MTLYELLRMVSFDELIPTLKGVYDVKDIYSYREAFDELMLNEAAGQTDGVIELSRDEDDENWIHVTGCHDCWSEVLASRIQIEDGLSFSDAELAARILWEMTYWGFSEDETPSFMERPDNKYRRKWSEMHSRQKVMYARGRKEKKECFREAMSWDIFITGRTLKRAILKVSEYADMKSGDIILKVVHSKD